MNFDEFRKARREAKANAYMLVSPFFLWLAWEVGPSDPPLFWACAIFGTLWVALGALVLYFKYLEWRNRR